MKPCVFTGCCVALVTPMTEEGFINLDSLKDLIEFVIDGGADALLVCGTSGESATLTTLEREQIIRCSVEIARGRLPVIVGTGSNDTQHAIAQSQQAQSLGADALLVVTPYYNKTSQAGLVQHFFAIADGVNLPVILYNVPLSHRNDHTARDLFCAVPSSSDCWGERSERRPVRDCRRKSTLSRFALVLFRE